MAGVSEKPLPPHRQAARDWVDWLWERKSAALLDEMFKRAEASRANGFQKGHAYHKRKDSDDQKR